MTDRAAAHQSGHGDMDTGSKNPDVRESSQKVFGTISSGFTALLVLFFLLLIKGCISDRRAEERAERVRETTAQQTPAVLVQTLELRVDCFTPCQNPIPFAFQIETEGEPVYIEYPHVRDYGYDRVYYSGKGQIDQPYRGTGQVRITSANPDRQTRVRIYEVVYRPQRR